MVMTIQSIKITPPFVLIKKYQLVFYQNDSTCLRTFRCFIDDFSSSYIIDSSGRFFDVIKILEVKRITPIWKKILLGSSLSVEFKFILGNSEQWIFKDVKNYIRKKINSLEYTIVLDGYVDDMVSEKKKLIQQQVDKSEDLLDLFYALSGERLGRE